MADPNDDENPKKRKPLKLPFDTTDLYDFEFANSLPMKFAQNYYTNVIPQVPELTITAGSSKITKVQKPKLPPRVTKAKKVRFLEPPSPNNQLQQDNLVGIDIISEKESTEDVEMDSMELYSYPEPEIPPPPLPPRRQLPNKDVHSAPVSSSVSRVESLNLPPMNLTHKQHLTKEIVIKGNIESRGEVKMALVQERELIYKSDDLDDSRLYIQEPLSSVDSKSSYNVSFLGSDDQAGPSASKSSLSPEKNARILNWMSVGNSTAKTTPNTATTKRNERSSSVKSDDRSNDKPLEVTLTKSEVFEFSNRLGVSKSQKERIDKSYPAPVLKLKPILKNNLEIPPEKIISLSRGNIEGNLTVVPKTEKTVSFTQGLNISEDGKSSQGSVDNTRIMPTKSTVKILETLSLGKTLSQDIPEQSESKEKKIPEKVSNTTSRIMQADDKSQQILALRDDITGKLVSMLSKNSQGSISPESIELAKGISEKLTAKLPKDISQNAISQLHRKISEKFGIPCNGCRLESGSSVGPKFSNTFLKALPEGLRPSATQVSQHKSDMLYLPIGIPVVANVDKKPYVVGLGKHLDSYLSKMISHVSIPVSEEPKREIITAPASLASFLPNVPSDVINLRDSTNCDSKVSLTITQVPSRGSRHSIIQNEPSLAVIPDLKSLQPVQSLLSEGIRSVRQIHSEHQASLEETLSENPKYTKGILKENQKSLNSCPSNFQFVESELRRIASENQESIGQVPSEYPVAAKRISTKNQESSMQIPSENQESIKPSKNQRSVKRKASKHSESVRQIPSSENQKSSERIASKNQVSLKSVPSISEELLRQILSENAESISQVLSKNQEFLVGIPGENQESLNKIPSVLPNRQSVTRIPVETLESDEKIINAIENEESLYKISSSIHNVQSITQISVESANGFPTGALQNAQSVVAVPSVIQKRQSVARLPDVQNSESNQGISDVIQNAQFLSGIASENSKLIPKESPSTISSIVALDKLSDSFGIESDNPSLIQQRFIIRKLPSGVTVNFRSMPQRSFVSVSRLHKELEEEAQMARDIFEIANDSTRQMSHTSVESVGGHSMSSNERSTASPNVSSIVFSHNSTNESEQKFNTDIFNELISRFGSTKILNEVYGEIKGEANLVVPDSPSDMPTIEEETDDYDAEYEEASVSQYSLVAHKGSLQSNPSLSEDSDDGTIDISRGRSTTQVASRMTQAPSSTASLVKPLKRPILKKDSITKSYDKMTNQMVDMLAKVEKKIESMDNHLTKMTQKQELEKKKMGSSRSSGKMQKKQVLGSIDIMESVKGISGGRDDSVSKVPSSGNQIALKSINGKPKLQVQDSSKAPKKKVSNSVTKSPTKLTVSVSKESNGKIAKQKMRPSPQELAKMPKGRANLRREPFVPEPEPLIAQRNFIQENIQRVSTGRSDSPKFSFSQNNGSYNNRNKQYLGLSDRQISEFLLSNFPITTATVSEMVSKPMFANDREIRQAVRSELASLLETNPTLNMPLKRQAKSFTNSEMARDLNRYMPPDNFNYNPTVKGRSAPQKSPYAKK